MYRVFFCSKLLGKPHSSGEVPFIIGSSLGKSRLYSLLVQQAIGEVPTSFWGSPISGVFFCRLKINLDAHARAHILHGPDVGVVYVCIMDTPS